jgi:anti-sigma-K factor RskA
MTNDDNIDGLAAEYVLGSLDRVEREEIAARRTVEEALDHAIKAWEKRLGPLSDLVPGLEPRPGLFFEIASQLWGTPDQVVDPARAPLRYQSTKRWRALSAGACALAAFLAMIVVWLFQNSPGSPAKLVAKLQRSAAATTADETLNATVPLGFVVSFDFRASTMIVSPVAARPASRRDYQLWLIPREAAPPISLGVISQAQSTTSPWLATYPPYDLANATLAVSLEPEGGSPNGFPTGPIVFSGKLVAAAS